MCVKVLTFVNSFCISVYKMKQAQENGSRFKWGRFSVIEKNAKWLPV